VNGVRLYFEISGLGPPLVLIHGWSSNSLCWDDQIPAFQKEFRVLRYDRRGFGKSSGLPDVTADPADLDALLTHLGIKSAIILGHSQGGYVALGFVQNYPQRVKALILYGAAPPDGFGVPWSGPDAWPLAQLKEAARTKGIDAIWQVLANHPLLSGDQMRPDALARVQKIRSMYSGADLQNELPQSGQTARPTMARTVDINIPTLVITGEKEMPYYRLVGDALAYAIPGASRVVIKNGGHRANASQPAAFNAAVSSRSFLPIRRVRRSSTSASP
jgi:3-oxoadipate enol-lactonase